MPKKMLMEKIKNLAEIMAPLMVEAGYKHNFLEVDDEALILDEYHLENAYHWLMDLHGHEWRNCLEIFSLLPFEVWERYDTWGGFEDHREMKMRKEARKYLKKRYSTRPLLFNKGKLTNAIKEKKKTYPNDSN